MTPIDPHTFLPLEYDDPNLQVAMDALNHDPHEDAENAERDRLERLDEQSDRSRWRIS